MNSLPLRHSLLTRLCLAVFLVIFLLMAFSLVNSLRQEKQHLQAQLQHQIQTQTSAYRTAIAPLLFIRDHASLHDILESWCVSENILYMVVKDPADDSILAASGWPEKTPLPTPGQDAGILHVTFPIHFDEQLYGQAHLGVSTTFIDNAQRDLLVTSLLLGFVELLVFTPLLFLALHHQTRRLTRLSQASAKVSQGDFSHRVPVQGNDEIAALASHLNAMIDAAQTHMQSLREGERRFRAIADYTYAWENWFDASGKLLWINPAVQRMVGYTPEECLAMPDFPLPLIHPDDQELIRYQTQLARDGLSGQDLEIRVLGRDGTHIWAAVSWQPIHDETGVPQGYRSSIRDTTMQHHTTEELSYQAVHDALTGIFNRRAFERRLQQVFEQPKAAPNQPHLAQLPLVVLYVDLDQFKSVNDTCGHEAGDQLLIELTGLLKEQVGPGFLARLGGDEFGIILRCSEEEGLRCAHRILHEVRNYVFQYQGRHFHPGLSIGVAQASEHLDSVSELLMAADAACYAAKERGRNRVELYIRDNEYFRLQREAFRSADHVANALNEERFLLYFQRVESLSPDAPHFAEVLLRMRDSHDCILTPENFLPAAERFNLMSHIDAWVIKNVCRQLSEWETANTLPEARYLSINISGASLSDQEFPDFVLQQISLYDIDPGRLCFEISERCAARYLPQTQAFIHRMRDLGIALALDDFGTGPSSFAHLKQLPVDFLKIDALFIQHLDQDSKDRAVVLSMLQLARLYGLKTVAEFVSNAAILKIVRELEVGYAQGYALHEPEPLPNLVGNGGDDKP